MLAGVKARKGVDLQRFGAALLASILVLLATFSSHADTNAKPQRIVSLSLCTDQILLQLVEKERIAAITFLGIDPIYSYEWQAAQGITTHSGLAESIIPLQPDLIIGSTYSTGNTSIDAKSAAPNLTNQHLYAL